MADRPQMAIGDLIVVESGLRAVVAWVRARGASRGDGVVVYLDEAKRARYDDVQWSGTQWVFVRERPSCGARHERGYAEFQIMGVWEQWNRKPA